jgi:hypothetical protein
MWSARAFEVTTAKRDERKKKKLQSSLNSIVKRCNLWERHVNAHKKCQ